MSSCPHVAVPGQLGGAGPVRHHQKSDRLDAQVPGDAEVLDGEVGLGAVGRDARDRRVGGGEGKFRAAAVPGVPIRSAAARLRLSRRHDAVTDVLRRLGHPVVISDQRP
jgi:hypothetical protein